jgi:hypothetical protein
MLSSIATCSSTIRAPIPVIRPADSRAMTPNVGRYIEAAISAFARRPWPRYAIQAIIGAVIVVAMPRNISAGASSVSSDQLVPTAPIAHPAGMPRTAMPRNMATTISA